MFSHDVVVLTRELCITPSACVLLSYFFGYDIILRCCDPNRVSGSPRFGGWVAPTKASQSDFEGLSLGIFSTPDFVKTRSMSHICVHFFVVGRGGGGGNLGG